MFSRGWALFHKMKTKLKLKSFNCQFFGVTIEIRKADFDMKDFLKAVPIPEASKEFAQVRQFRAVCNRKTNKIDYSAHVIVHSPKEEGETSGVTIHIDLWPAKRAGLKEEKPPFAEDIFEWFRAFISDQAKIKIYERIELLFPMRQYESVFAIPVRMSGPLNLTGSAVFEDSLISGVQVTAGANNMGISSVLQDVQSNENISTTARRFIVSDPSKLASIEPDAEVLYNVVKTTVRRKRKRS
jgi:hypothetical protein